MARDPVTVLMLSWERPLYLWACLDSFWRHTRRAARFILHDNGSRDPRVREILRGFRRRGMFHELHLHPENDPGRIHEMFARHASLLGDRFVFVETDVQVEPSDPCWLTRFEELMDAHRDLALVGSAVETGDFVDPARARELAGDLTADELELLVKARSAERDPATSENGPLLDVGVPGRLVMIRTEVLQRVPLQRDGRFVRALRDAGCRAAVAPAVRHRHLSLLNFWDYPDYDVGAREDFFRRAGREGEHPERVRFIRPTLPGPESWEEHLRESYSCRRFSNFGPANARFEEALTARFGGGEREAVTCCNATTGLTAALLALGAEGDVVLPSFTFAATGHAVLRAGGRPAFVDVSPRTWELCPEALERRLQEGEVRAVVHVRALGLHQDLFEVEAVCRAHGVPLLVDGASSLGEAAGDAEVVSFHATKVLGIGEGGCVLAPPALARRVRRASNFALTDGDILGPALNGKLSDFHAAVGLSVLERLDGFVARRREVAARYGEAAAGWGSIRACWPEEASPWPTWPALLHPSIDAQLVVDAAAEEGVELRRYYSPPLHDSRAFRGFTDGPLPVTEDLSRSVVCLPVYSDMTDAEQDRVLDVMGRLLSGVPSPPRTEPAVR